MRSILLPYYPIVTEKKASEQLGVSLTKVRKLISDGLLEVSLRGGKLLVNNFSLKKYIDIQTCNEKNMKDEIYEEIKNEQYNIINKAIKILSLCLDNRKSIIEAYYKSEKDELHTYASKLAENLDYPFFKYFTIPELCDYYLVYKLHYRNERAKSKLLQFGMSQDDINMTIDSYYNYMSSKNSKNKNFNWKIETPTLTIKNTSEYREFLVTYKKNFEKFEKIKFLPFSKVKQIILRVKERRVS